MDFKSPNMERLGLRRTLESMAGKLDIAEVATDASTSIKAMLGLSTLKMMYFELNLIILQHETSHTYSIRWMCGEEIIG